MLGAFRMPDRPHRRPALALALLLTAGCGAPDGDPERAAVELRAANYYLRYVDDVSPEAREVRKHAS